MSWGTSPVEYGVGPCFDGPIKTLRRVLILMIGFRIPTTTLVQFEDVLNFIGDFNLSIITDEFTHSSPKLNIILQSVYKLFGGLHTLYIRHLGVLANK